MFMKYYKFRSLTHFLNLFQVLQDKDSAASVDRMFSETMTCLVAIDKVKAEDVDQLKSSFRSWHAESELPAFKPPQTLDKYYSEVFSGTKNKSLWRLVKMLLVLSHGQAQVERGFSVNKETMTENLTERAAIAKRLVCDHVCSVGGILKVDLNHGLLASVSSARGKYRKYLEEQKAEKEGKEG